MCVRRLRKEDGFGVRCRDSSKPTYTTMHIDASCIDNYISYRTMHRNVTPPFKTGCMIN